MNAFKGYIDFIGRDHKNNNNDNIKLVDIYPNFYSNCILCSVFFIALNLLLPIVIRITFPSF